MGVVRSEAAEGHPVENMAASVRVKVDKDAVMPSPLPAPPQNPAHEHSVMQMQTDTAHP